MTDAAHMLERDHRKVEQLFERFKQGDRNVMMTVCNELTVHSAIEEEVLYPVLPEVAGGDALKRQGEHEHQEVKDAIARLRRVAPDSEEADALMRTIIEGVTHHVKEEEGEVLPELTAGLGPSRMEELGDRLTEAKREHLRADGLLDELSRDELYDMARALHVEGRSDMTKDELVAALGT